MKLAIDKADRLVLINKHWSWIRFQQPAVFVYQFYIQTFYFCVYGFSGWQFRSVWCIVSWWLCWIETTLRAKGQDIIIFLWVVIKVAMNNSRSCWCYAITFLLTSPSTLSKPLPEESVWSTCLWPSSKSFDIAECKVKTSLRLTVAIVACSFLSDCQQEVVK